ncbi:MAG: hypothetical protein AAB112_02465, partial [Thermodesulfobacteriota bacterium]
MRFPPVFLPVSFAGDVIAGGASALDLWLAQAIRFLAGIEPPPIAARTPDQVRLVLSTGERRAVIAFSVGV